MEIRLRADWGIRENVAYVFWITGHSAGPTTKIFLGDQTAEVLAEACAAFNAVMDRHAAEDPAILADIQQTLATS